MTKRLNSGRTVHEPGAQAPRRQEPIVIDNHDDDELSEHGIIIEADGSFGWVLRIPSPG
jgi:hypothetical protein